MDHKTLEKINALTRRTFKAEELYTFPVTLCGNEIDRDGERFSGAALEQMAKLFVGKTIIIDHDPSAANQTARVYDTELVTDTEKLTSYGEPYRYLKGYAYMVKTAGNASTITLIDGGILKEVSVSCSAASRKCSVCGKELYHESCEHIKGNAYDGQICHHILDGITDAYELSFVAVPAQADAGVTKKSFEGGNVMEGFTPITTKAAFDTAVQPLIDAAVSAKAAEFEGWLSPEAHQQALDALKNEHKSVMLKSYREKAALMTGLAPELADRLNGDTEEDIQKDAESFAKYFVNAKLKPSPRFSSETPFADSRTASQLEMLREIKNN